MALRFQQIELAGVGHDLYPTIAATGSGQLVQIQSSHGYLQLGSNNTSYCHFQTDRPTFYFNKNITVDGGEIRSYDENLNLVRANSNASFSLGEDSNATNDGWAVLKVGEKKGFFMQNGSQYLTKYLHSVRTDSASPTHTAYYQWYTLKNPAGYSNQGLASTFKVKIYTAGKHANGSTYSEYLVRCHNANNSGTSGLGNSEVFCLLRTGYGDGYGGTNQDVTFYHRTGLTAWNTGEIIFSVARANREPVDVIKIEPIGADTSTDWMPTLVSHGGGTGANDGRPTTDITAINMQYGGLHRTSGTDGRLLIDVNGKGANTAHEIARFVNTNSAATSSYMYIGATSGTDWRLGKAVFGSGSNFTIAKHSGSTAAISINSSGNGYVGIGVNDASYPLHIVGNVYSTTRFQGGNTLIGSNAISSTNFATLGSNSSGVGIALARDHDANTYKDLIINSSGNVALGTAAHGSITSNVRTLTIDGTNGNVSGGIILKANGTNVQSWYWESNNMRYQNIGDYSHTFYKNNSTVLFTIATSGTVTATGDVVAYSDEKLKTDIKTLDGSKVYEMRGVSFIKDEKEGSGVIAQELEKVAPELVNNDSEYKSVAYGNITGYLIEAIKDLKEEIEELKSNKCNCNK